MPHESVISLTPLITFSITYFKLFCPSVWLTVWLHFCLSVHMKFCLPAWLSVYLSVCLSFYLSVCLSIGSVSPSVCYVCYVSMSGIRKHCYSLFIAWHPSLTCFFFFFPLLFFFPSRPLELLFLLIRGLFSFTQIGFSRLNESARSTGKIRAIED